MSYNWGALFAYIFPFGVNISRLIWIIITVGILMLILMWMLRSMGIDRHTPPSMIWRKIRVFLRSYYSPILSIQKLKRAETFESKGKLEEALNIYLNLVDFDGLLSSQASIAIHNENVLEKIESICKRVGYPFPIQRINRLREDIYDYFLVKQKHLNPVDYDGSPLHRSENEERFCDKLNLSQERALIDGFQHFFQSFGIKVLKHITSGAIPIPEEEQERMLDTAYGSMTGSFAGFSSSSLSGISTTGNFASFGNSPSNSSMGGLGPAAAFGSSQSHANLGSLNKSSAFGSAQPSDHVGSFNTPSPPSKPSMSVSAFGNHQPSGGDFADIFGSPRSNVSANSDENDLIPPSDLFEFDQNSGSAEGTQMAPYSFNSGREQFAQPQHQASAYGNTPSLSAPDPNPFAIDDPRLPYQEATGLIHKLPGVEDDISSTNNDPFSNLLNNQSQYYSPNTPAQKTSGAFGAGISLPQPTGGFPNFATAGRSAPMSQGNPSFPQPTGGFPGFGHQGTPAPMSQGNPSFPQPTGGFPGFGHQGTPTPMSQGNPSFLQPTGGFPGFGHQGTPTPMSQGNPSFPQPTGGFPSFGQPNPNFPSSNSTPPPFSTPTPPSRSGKKS